MNSFNLHAPRPARAPITLVSGRVVTFTRAANGSQDAHMADDNPMSVEEWDELCKALRDANQSARLHGAITLR